MANIKFSAFTQKVALGDVDFLVGYTGADNVRVAPSIFSGIYLPLAGGTMTGNTINTPGTEVRFGNSNEMALFYSSATSHIRINSGDLFIRADDMKLSNQAKDEYYLTAVENGAVELYYDAVKKFETEAGGVIIPSGDFLSWGTSGVTSIEGSTVSNKIAFRTSSTNRATINDTGLGIGVVPTTILDIGGMADPIVLIKSDVGGDPQLRFDGSAANRSGLIKFYDNGAAAGGFIDYHHLGDKMNFGAGSVSTVTMTVSDGKVGIGIDPLATLQVNCTTDVNFTTSANGSNLRLNAVNDAVAATISLEFNATDYEFLGTGAATFGGNIELGDGQQLQCGPLAGGDLKFYWDTTDGNIVNKTGHLYLINQANDKNIYFQTDDGAGGTTTYIKCDGLQNFTEFPVNTRHLDNVYAQFGTSNDGHIYHNGTDMTIQNSYDDGDMNFKSDDGSGGVAAYFWLDGGVVKTRVAKDMNFEDNVKASFGNVVTPDLEIYHDTGNSYIVDTGTGSLKVGAANWHLMDSALAAYMMTATPGAEVNLYYNGSGRFITTSDGVKVTGQYNVAALNTAPASASAAGTLGEIRYTADYIYVCTATNTWKRTALSTW